jgi:hypothetical protein
LHGVLLTASVMDVLIELNKKPAFRRVADFRKWFAIV